MPLTARGSAGFRGGPPETGRRPRDDSKTVACLGAILLTAVVATGCSAPHSARSATAPAKRPADLVLPFDAYKPNPQQRVLLARAQALLVARCMRRLGVEATPPALTLQEVRSGDPGNSRRYGVVDTAVAARFGYHLSRQGDPAKLPAWGAKLAEADRRHLYGTDDHPGCADQAAKALDEGAEKADWPWLALQDSHAVERSATKPAVTDALGRWQLCMNRAGFSYSTPEDAIGDRRWRLEQSAVSAEEKRTAIADTACKWDSGLVAAWFAADADLQRGVIGENADRFAALRANLQHRLARAAELLEEDLP